MRAFCKGLIIAAAFATLVGLGGTARAQTYEWEYSLNGGATFTVLNLLTGSNNAQNAIASASPVSGLTISINTASNNPGSSGQSFLFNTTTSVNNTTGNSYTVIVGVTETGFTTPTGPGNLTGSVQAVTISQVNQGGATATGSFSGVQGFLAPGNAAFGTTDATNIYSQGTLTASGGGTATGATGTLAYSGNPFTAGSSYSMTLIGTVTVSPNATSTDKISVDYTTVVPEPSTMAIAGLGALGMIGYGLRRGKGA